MGTWFTAKKDGRCKHCGGEVLVGQDMYAAARGVYMCRECGIERDTGERIIGDMEAGAIESLRKFPDEATGSALGQGILYLARYLDQGDVSPREIPNFTKEIRQALAQLAILFPPVPEGDGTDEAQDKRERRLAGLEEWEPS